MKRIEKIITILFFGVLLLSGWIRYQQTKNFNTAFTYDQSRDMLDIRVLGEFKDLAVLGPTTSINGLRLGPFYYYFNLPAYWIGNGNPQLLVYWNIFLFLFTGGFIFWFFRKRNITTGLFVSTLFLTAPQLFSMTRYFWNANMAAYLSTYFFLAVWYFLEKRDKKAAILLGVSAGLLTQFEAAFGIVCVAFSFLLLLINSKKKINDGKFFLIGLIPWFLPQILLEIKNKFQMTKLLLGVFSGTNDVLGEKLSFIKIIQLHFETIKSFFEGQLVLPYGWGLLVVILAAVIILLSKDFRKIGKYLLGFLLFAFIFYVAIYHHELKHWYLDSLRVWYCFVIGLALSILAREKKLIKFIPYLFWVLIVYSSGKDQLLAAKMNTSDDPKNLNNLIKSVDWVYQKNEGKGFEAYNYVPEIYDYPYQYLYWWYGIKKYGYMPEKVSYSVTEVPEYIRSQQQFVEKTKKSEGRIALIYENRANYIGWLDQFKNFCTVAKEEAGWKVTMEIRERCK